MSNQPATPSKPSNPETTELLRRIALATEASIANITALREEISSLLEATKMTMEASTATAETLSRIAEAFSRQPAPAAASAAPTTPAGEYVDFAATCLVMSSDDAGNPVYKVRGDRFQKFGVRVWPEVLPALGIDPASLKPGPNVINLTVRALMGETGPRKIISKAPLF